jgi:integrase
MTPIKQRNGTWRDQPRINGKRISVTAPTRRECERKVAELREQTERGVVYDAYKTRAAEYVTNWLENHKTRIRPNTYSLYHWAVNSYILPHLGQLKLIEINAGRIQGMYDQLQRDGASAQTLIVIHAVLSTCLKQAHKQGLIFDKPTERVDPPSSDQEEMRVWSEEQVSAFLLSVRGDKHEALYHLALKLGPRKSEIFGLQTRDIDWLKQTIHIRRQVYRPPTGGWNFAPLKTKRANRVLAVGDGLLDQLRRQLDRVQAMRLEAKSWQENDLLFPSAAGTPMNSRIGATFERATQRAGLPQIRFHDMRHTAVSIMLANGIQILTVSRIIGHSNPAVTLSVYGHLMPGSMEEAAALMDEVTQAVAVDMVRDWHNAENDHPNI